MNESTGIRDTHYYSATLALYESVINLLFSGHFLSKICHYTNERRRREDRGAEGAEGEESGEGVSPSPAD